MYLGSKLDTRHSHQLLCSAYMYDEVICPQVPPNPEAEDPEVWRREEQERIDSATPLTEEEITEKEALLQEVGSPLVASLLVG